MIERTVEELTPIVGARPACRALGASPATVYRRRRPPEPRPRRPRPTPARALSETEREQVLEVLHSERFVDSSPAQVWATLLDEGRYLASERTMYRLLAARHGGVRERRDQLTHPGYVRPELLAERPNELWSWDITKLLGPAKWTYFYLLSLVQPPAPPLRDRADDSGRCPLRPGKAAPRRPRQRPRGRVRAQPRTIRPPPRAAPAANRRVDQQARRQGGGSLNSNPDRLIRVDRVRSSGSGTPARATRPAAAPLRSPSARSACTVRSHLQRRDALSSLALGSSVIPRSKPSHATLPERGLADHLAEQQS